MAMQAMIMRHHTMKLIYIGVLAIVLGLFAVGNGLCAEPGLDKTKFTATGYNETLLHITTPGRYSIQAHSPQGTMLELVPDGGAAIFSRECRGTRRPVRCVIG